MQLICDSYQTIRPFRNIVNAYVGFLGLSTALLATTLFMMGVALKLSIGITLIYVLSYLLVGQIMYIRHQLADLASAPRVTQLQRALHESQEQVIQLQEEIDYWRNLPAATTTPIEDLIKKTCSLACGRRTSSNKNEESGGCHRG